MNGSKFVNGRELLELELTQMPALIEPILPRVGLAAV
jgi:hypothetical protein